MMSRGMSKVSNFTFIFNLKLDNGAAGGVSLISKRAKAHNKKGNGTLYFAFCLAQGKYIRKEKLT